MKPFPNTVDDLIEDLDRTFPEPAFTAADTMDTIKFVSGQRSVIQFLKTWRASPQQRQPQAKRGAGRVSR